MCLQLVALNKLLNYTKPITMLSFLPTTMFTFSQANIQVVYINVGLELLMSGIRSDGDFFLLQLHSI